MKQNFLKQIAVGVLFSTIIIACTKNKNTTESRLTDLESFFTRNSVPLQTFEISAATGGVITGANGTKFTIPAAAFVTTNGTAATGTIQIEVKELLTKTDLLLSNKPTISGTLPLESGGTWLFKPTMAGQVLRIAPGKLVNVNIPRDTLQGGTGDMFLFNAAPAQGNPNNPINWGDARRGGTIGGVQNIVPLSSPTNNYFCGLDSVGWGNADRFMSMPNYALGTVVTGNYTSLTNTTCFYLYKGKKIVWPVSKNSAGFLDGHIAKNQVGHLVMFEIVNGQLMVGTKQNMTILANNETHNITMSATSEAAFKTLLQSLL